MSDPLRQMEGRNEEKKSRGCLLPLVIVLVLAVAGLLWVRHNFYAPFFSPTRLSPPEERSLEVKLDRLQFSGPAGDGDDPGAVKPYSEEGADRTIRFSEKEINSLLAEEEETAKRVSLKLSDDLVTLRLVVPVDEEAPVLGGRTLRLKAGVTLAYRDGLPMVALRGVSLGGLPLPNAWLGNLKNINLVEEFSEEGGFWKLFADGVEDMEVKEGHIRITLKE